jgi:hypothetical protein
MSWSFQSFDFTAPAIIAKVKMQLIAALLFPLLALSIPVPQSDVYCGSNDYSSKAISDASSAACGYVTSGTTAGTSTYPHKYNDYEGFTFMDVSGPYYEFPILPSGRIYSGGRLSSDKRNVS